MTFIQIRSTALATLILLSTGLATALTMAPINLGQIVEHTEKGFEGEAVSVEVVKVGNEWADKVTFKIIDPIIGAIQAGENVTWFQLRGGEQFPLAGMPQYEPGKSYVVFLAGKAPGSQLQAPIGLGQGSFQVHVNIQTGEKLARNEFENTSLFENVDMQSLTADIAAGLNSATRSTTGSQPSATALEVQSNLSGGPAGATNLLTLKKAAKAFKAKPNPAGAYKMAGPQPGMSVRVTP